MNKSHRKNCSICRHPILSGDIVRHLTGTRYAHERCVRAHGISASKKASGQ